MYARAQRNPTADGHSVRKARWKLIRSKNLCSAFSVCIRFSLTQLFYLLVRSYFIALTADADIGLYSATHCYAIAWREYLSQSL